MLFAFLLTVPFSQRFTTLDTHQRSVFFGAFLSTALASILLMAPTAYHRLRWRQYDKERMLSTANSLTIAGLLALTVAITLVVYLIGDVVYGSPVSGTVSAIVVAALAWFWFGLPLLRRIRDTG